MSRRLRAQTRFELSLLARNGENLLVSLAVPLGFLVFFAAVPLPGMASDPLDVLVPAVLTIALMGSGLVAVGVSTAFEREQGVLRRYRVSALGTGELAAAKALAIGLVQVVQVGVVLGGAVALGWRPTPGVGGVALLLLALPLASAAFAGIGLALAGALPALRALAVINAVFLALILLGGAAVPRSLLPGPLALIAAATPTAQVIDLLTVAFRSATLASAGVLLGPVLTLLAWATLGWGLAVRLLPRE